MIYIFLFFQGLNANLRSTFVYDVLGLNWSDDGFFAYACISQAFGILIGLPVAGNFQSLCSSLHSTVFSSIRILLLFSGLVYDHFKNYYHMMYMSGISFILAGLVMSPVQNATLYFTSAYKALNRFYFQRK